MSVSLAQAIYSAVKPIIRMYLIILTGLFMTKMGFVSVATTRALSDLVLLLFMPALVFDKIVSYISIDDIKTIAVTCLSAFMMYCCNAGVTAVIVSLTPVPKKKNDSWIGGAMLAGIMQNVSDIPISYLQALTVFSEDETNKGTAYVIIWLTMYLLVQFNCGMFQLVEYDFRRSHDVEEEPKPPALEPIAEEPGAVEDGDPETASKQSLSNTSLSSSNSYESARLEDLEPHALVNDHEVHTLRAAVARIPSARSHIDYGLSRTTSNASSIPSVVLSRQSSVQSGAQSHVQELIREYSHNEPYNRNVPTNMKIITETNLSSKDIQNAGKSPFVRRYKLHYLIFFLENFKKPSSTMLVVSLIIALIPWLKALFVQTDVYMPTPPDKEPPLSFLLQYADYCAAPCVPLGLFMIGCLLGRLEITAIPPGFWKSILCHTAYRLCILPIIGILWVYRLKSANWMTDSMAQFVTCLEFSLPSATVQVYLTASHMDPEKGTDTQINCLSLYIIAQYISLVVTLPIVVCYTLKNVIDI
ncbi:hypothetical protein OGAPHI_001139 [Ogataea philodendri]|uniref:Protein ECM3 n=1 Tax=Ogataea philodendri TaxID=1378263 RepID=A0A9P8T9I3_9ASCO|nr:uncharacterized protein OGAPHI_001139 [Ogataea philodendri]KAH3670624.1 hypothetical protein OGAPHI_001139 [Ogataea philodendri]